MLSSYADRAPLGRTVTTEEVGNVQRFYALIWQAGSLEKSVMWRRFNTAALSVNEYEDR